MKSNRYKVWARVDNGMPSEFLMRTGSAEDLDGDIGDFTGTPREVAAKARELTGFSGAVHVKDFDTGCCYTVDPEGQVTEGWET